MKFLALPPFHGSLEGKNFVFHMKHEGGAESCNGLFVKESIESVKA